MSHVERFFVNKIEEENIGNIWFQQEDATCHTSEATLDVLRPFFEDCIISCRADVVCPSRRFDTTGLLIKYSRNTRSVLLDPAELI